ncbi:MAG: sterol desaturase family protein [Paracoccaceae bacterium]|nr:sterol desaturase family protein [Paracoccaceae bacterium]
MTELWLRVVEASQELVWVSIAFFLVSLVIKGRATSEWIKRSWGEARLNLFYYFLDLVLVVPVGALMIAGINFLILDGGLAFYTPESYDAWPPILVLLFCVATSDFIGYWRHRLLHTWALWPVHAIHHSDTEMTWTTLARFHPINRLMTTGLNAAFLSLLGVPPGFIALNGIFRHYYGYFIHADIPWSYGPLRFVLVSPIMHRWHHVREVEGSGSNFATVFALYDLAFRSFYMPPRVVPSLGITEPRFPDTWLGQTLYPFRVWAGRMRREAAEAQAAE